MFELTVDAEIKVRTLHPDDAETLHALLERNRARLRLWIHPSALPETAQAARKYTIECYFYSLDPLEAIDTPYIDEVGPYYPPPFPPMEMGIWFCGELVGIINLSIVEDNLSAAEFGYWITEQQEGKGIVTRCVGALMNYGIDEMKIETFLIGCATMNQRSAAIPKQLGYHLQATIPNGEVIGEYIYDRSVYEISSTVWRERNNYSR